MYISFVIVIYSTRRIFFLDIQTRFFFAISSVLQSTETHAGDVKKTSLCNWKPFNTCKFYHFDNSNNTNNNRKTHINKNNVQKPNFVFNFLAFINLFCLYYILLSFSFFLPLWMNRNWSLSSSSLSIDMECWCDEFSQNLNTLLVVCFVPRARTRALARLRWRTKRIYLQQRQWQWQKKIACTI